MDMIHQLVTIFCEMDDFCNDFNTYQPTRLLSVPSTGHRGPVCALSTSEIMTILVMLGSGAQWNSQVS